MDLLGVERVEEDGEGEDITGEEGSENTPESYVHIVPSDSEGTAVHVVMITIIHKRHSSMVTWRQLQFYLVCQVQLHCLFTFIRICIHTLPSSTSPCTNTSISPHFSAVCVGGGGGCMERGAGGGGGGGREGEAN